MIRTLLSLLPLLVVGLIGPAQAQDSPEKAPNNKLIPLFTTLDLELGESRTVTLSNGKQVQLKLLKLKEDRDPIRSAVRAAHVTLEIDGKHVELVAATYHRPVTVGAVQVDCSITSGYNSNGTKESWALDADARIRLWPAGSPLLRRGTFGYPVKQRWFATHTQMANVPTYVDGGETPSRKSIYYHSGLDIGGCEGLVDVVSATDALVVSSGLEVLDAHGKETPVRTRYDVVYLLDARGWYYRYSHLKSIDDSIKPGRLIKQGDPIGVLGKEGASGGWTHLHFEIKSRQPSGRWGTQAGYAFLWDAYQRAHKPKIIAVARPHHLIWVGEEVTLDGLKSWSEAGEISKFAWRFGDGTQATGSTTRRRYDKPGSYSEVMKITDAAGNVAYDFAIVQVIDREHPDRVPPTVHPTYSPTFGIKAGDDVTFKVRTFRTQHGDELWDFGDGSPTITTHSDGNAEPRAADGYAVTTHRYEKPGDYIVRVERTNEYGATGVGLVWVRVGR